jgi:hypothetical protein
MPELSEIDRFAVEGDVNPWAPSSNAWRPPRAAVRQVFS